VGRGRREEGIKRDEEGRKEEKLKRKEVVWKGDFHDFFTQR